MWDTDQQTDRGEHLSHDLPCFGCGHASHSFLACSDTCSCGGFVMPGAA